MLGAATPNSRSSRNFRFSSRVRTGALVPGVVYADDDDARGVDDPDFALLLDAVTFLGVCAKTSATAAAKSLARDDPPLLIWTAYSSPGPARAFPLPARPCVPFPHHLVPSSVRLRVHDAPVLPLLVRAEGKGGNGCQYGATKGVERGRHDEGSFHGRSNEICLILMLRSF